MNNYSKVLIGSLALALANIPVADARSCYYDRWGRYRCRGGLSRAARIGMGIGIAVAALLVLGLFWCLFILRRRRARRANGGVSAATGPFQHDKHPQQPGGYQPYPGSSDYENQNGHGYGSSNYPVNEPQFPTPSYQGNGAYAPPTGPPPAQYAPPSGPPPAK
ncbi:hypothetical protein RSOLAG1IB_01788 [Rhizoctonia solani AG-1 IB]|uniref:Uncharacterized protein n=1 Tax=Thanatephorus cucumeris (strain AG1-IB / isolate 7/3/14) TaxID=1108050 RepID=A0A0B7FCL3_THACB|nr:hypothetical protein RSOLAG1IB_01788 [Rhizoctonia solani AG-1 IB]